jgi:hypothetical protein
MPTLTPLTTEARAAHQATHLVRITHLDLTEATANTAQTLTLFTAEANKAVRLVKHSLPIPFKDASDAALNDTAIQVGVSGTLARFLASTQINVNGTEVRVLTGPAVPALPAAVSTADATTEATVYALANALKVSINALIAALQAGPGYVHSADTAILLTVGSMSGKSLSNIDVGVLDLYFDIQD